MDCGARRLAQLLPTATAEASHVAVPSCGAELPGAWGLAPRRVKLGEREQPRGLARPEPSLPTRRAVALRPGGHVARVPYRLGPCGGCPPGGLVVVSVVGTTLLVVVGGSVTLGDALLLLCAADRQSAARQVAAQSSRREAPDIVSSAQASRSKAAASQVPSSPASLRRRPREARPAGARGGHVSGPAGGGAGETTRKPAGGEEAAEEAAATLLLGGSSPLSRKAVLLVLRGPRATQWSSPHIGTTEGPPPRRQGWNCPRDAAGGVSPRRLGGGPRGVT